MYALLATEKASLPQQFMKQIIGGFFLYIKILVRAKGERNKQVNR